MEQPSNPQESHLPTDLYLVVVRFAMDDYPIRLFASEQEARDYLATDSWAEGVRHLEGTAFGADPSILVRAGILHLHDGVPDDYTSIIELDDWEASDLLWPNVVPGSEDSNETYSSH